MKTYSAPKVSSIPEEIIEDDTAYLALLGFIALLEQIGGISA
jgi:hypothetical protein